MRPKPKFHSKSKLLYLLLRHKIKHLMCKCCCSHSLTPQILYTLLLRKRLIPPKRSHQSFLQLKKIGVSHQNRTTIIIIKSYKTEKAAILNSHAYFSFFMEQQQQLLHFLRFKASLGLHSRLQRWRYTTETHF
ncbi:hypothetical protein ACB098_01G356900 [Castanea mollissima]